MSLSVIFLSMLMEINCASQCNNISFFRYKDAGENQVISA